MDVAAGSLAALLVLSVGLTDGGYYGTASTQLTTILVAVSLLGLVGGLRPEPSRACIALLAALALFTVWVALSSLWAVPGAAVALEIRRAGLYLAALAATVVVVRTRSRHVFLLGLLAAICLVGAVAIAMRVTSGTPVDPLYGNLLEEPVGYPNALGVLVAIGVVLAIGLGSGPHAPHSRVLGTAAPFLVFVLGLTGSRGGALALCLGLATLALLTPAGGRTRTVSTSASALAIGGAAWTLVQWHHIAGAMLLALAAATVTMGWLTSSRLAIRPRALPVLAVAALPIAVVLVALKPPAVSTSYRSDYWRAAIAEAAEHPLLGSGAGSYHLSWLEHRDVDLTVRDAHSLYVETLSELGPVGLLLVLVLVTAPLAVAVRRRADPLAAAAGAGFLVFAAHAAVDWDWEMPVVTLAGLACAGVLVSSAEQVPPQHRTTGRQR